MKTERLSADVVEKFLDGYYESLRQRTFISKADGGWVCIETPFTGLFNDMICLYARMEGENIEFSDGGETLSNLEMAGVSLRSVRDIVMRSINNHGLSVEHSNSVETIHVECLIDDAFERYHDILSCLVYLNGLDVLAKPESVSFFRHEVDSFFAQHSIGVIPSFKMKGGTGLDYDFDFGISGKSECVLIKSFNVFTKPHVATFQFGIDDIRAEHSHSRKIRAVAIINEQKPINQSLLNVFDLRGTRYLKWSERDSDASLKLFEVA